MRIGALDVGTNTVLMLVAERTDDGRVRGLAELSRITRLGRGVDRSGRLDPDSAARTLETIVEFAEQARALGAGKIVTAATAALRDACDGAEFIARVKARAGIDLEIVSGATEARLSYLAVVHGLQVDRGKRLLIVDIGGGSTEFIRAEPGHELEMLSLQIGSVRLTERIVHHDPPGAGEARELRRVIDEAIDGTGRDLRPEILVGIAGTVTTVCAVALGLATYDPAAVHGYRLACGEVERIMDRFGALPLAERKKLPGLVEGRADVIFAGTMILACVMEKAGVDSVIVSDQGVRWGLVWREFEF
jgi:exopolyphosphatase / guanosine-5'-triphosphate,3'-diphosphate pyrophosphatase